MLEMRPSCECCDRDLAPWAEDVLICSFECTWCAACAEHFADGRCPNCRGVLTVRPGRAREELASSPASTRRVHNPGLAAAQGNAPGS